MLAADKFDIVGTAPDGKVALRMCAEIAPDAIVLDISIPELNGMEVARRLRAAGYKAPIVFLSTNVDFVMDAMEAGGSAFVSKQLMSSDLGTAIREALAGRVFVSGWPKGKAK